MGTAESDRFLFFATDSGQSQNGHHALKMISLV